MGCFGEVGFWEGWSVELEGNLRPEGSGCRMEVFFFLRARLGEACCDILRRELEASQGRH